MCCVMVPMPYTGTLRPSGQRKNRPIQQQISAAKARHSHSGRMWRALGRGGAADGDDHADGMATGLLASNPAYDGRAADDIHI